MTRLTHRLLVLLLTIMTGSSVAFAQTAPYTRTVIVPANGTATANGTALITALASLSPAPDYANRWLIKLEPGIYDVGTTPVVMREYVDIEGSGIIETDLRGSVAPPAGFLLGGLVQGASKAEIRSLTINCLSNATAGSCQAVSLDGASPRLTQLRILLQGTGTGSHWGIRTVDSGPILDGVEILVAVTGANNYGIVYGGQSTLNIKRSSIVARNATTDNLAIVIKEDLNWSPMRDSTVTAIGGSLAMGISYLDSSTGNPLFLDNVIIAAYAASGENTGIGRHPGSSYGPSAKIFVQGGRILGSTNGVSFPPGGTTVELKHTEVEASQYIAEAANVRLYFVRAKGTGTVEGWSTEQCAAVVNNAGAFLASTCP